MRIYWPQDKLQSILAEAERAGEIRYWFKTISDAERFRYACYGLRKRKKPATQFNIFLDRRDCSILIRHVRGPAILEQQPARAMETAR